MEPMETNIETWYETPADTVQNWLIQHYAILLENIGIIIESLQSLLLNKELTVTIEETPMDSTREKTPPT